MLLRRAVGDVGWSHYIGEVISVQKVANTTGNGVGGIITAYLELVLELADKVELYFRGYPDMHIELPAQGYLMMGVKG